MCKAKFKISYSVERYKRNLLFHPSPDTGTSTCTPGHCDNSARSRICGVADLWDHGDLRNVAETVAIPRRPPQCHEDYHDPLATPRGRKGVAIPAVTPRGRRDTRSNCAGSQCDLHGIAVPPCPRDRGGHGKIVARPPLGCGGTEYFFRVFLIIFYFLYF